VNGVGLVWRDRALITGKRPGIPGKEGYLQFETGI